MFNIKDEKFKKKLLSAFIGALLAGIIWTFVLYLCLTDYNGFIVELMKTVNENNLEFSVCMIFYPVIVILSFILYAGKYAIYYRDDFSNNKTKKGKK